MTLPKNCNECKFLWFAKYKVPMCLLGNMIDDTDSKPEWCPRIELKEGENGCSTMMLDEKDMMGKKIKDIQIGGYGVLIVLEDGTIFDYNSRSGGDSYWDIYREGNNCRSRMVE